jgi:cytosine/adenosine deaminase-related metal-dependent hydrolase
VHQRAGAVLPVPVEPLDAMIKSVEACAQRYHDPALESMSRVSFAPTAPPWSVTPDELKVIAAAARGLGLRLHSHLSETNDYVEFCLNNFGKRPVHWIAEHDWLGPDVWFAHLVHLDASEVDLLVETGTGMSHCPQSNCRLGSGIAPADRLAALGGAVSPRPHRGRERRHSGPRPRKTAARRGRCCQAHRRLKKPTADSGHMETYPECLK